MSMLTLLARIRSDGTRINGLRVTLPWRAKYRDEYLIHARAEGFNLSHCYREHMAATFT